MENNSETDRADDDVAFALRLIDTCKRGVSMPEEAHRAIEHTLAGEIERLRQQRTAALTLAHELERATPGLARKRVAFLLRAALGAADEPTTGGGDPTATDPIDYDDLSPS